MRTLHDIAVPADHPAFAGHFPGKPILPGAALLDAVLPTIAAELGWDLGACEIAAAKFLGIVRPGAALQLSFALRPEGSVAFTVRETGRNVASGILLPPGMHGGEP
jgi:3-hydroxymyristoyl/3-hydroxydecanoyl-(acyl carrier protein) dehydratase